MGDGAAELEPNGDGLLLAGVLEPNGVAVAVLEPKGEAPDNGGLPKGDGALEDAPKGDGAAAGFAPNCDGAPEALVPNGDDLVVDDAPNGDDAEVGVVPNADEAAGVLPNVDLSFEGGDPKGDDMEPGVDVFPNGEEETFAVAPPVNEDENAVLPAPEVFSPNGVLVAPDLFPPKRDVLDEEVERLPKPIVVGAGAGVLSLVSSSGFFTLYLLANLAIISLSLPC